jgi:hypothetical protein
MSKELIRELNNEELELVSGGLNPQPPPPEPPPHEQFVSSRFSAFNFATNFRLSLLPPSPC